MTSVDWKFRFLQIEDWKLSKPRAEDLALWSNFLKTATHQCFAFKSAGPRNLRQLIDEQVYVYPGVIGPALILLLKQKTQVRGELHLRIYETLPEQCSMLLSFDDESVSLPTTTEIMRFLCSYFEKKIGIKKIRTMLPSADLSLQAICDAMGMKQEALFRHHFRYDDLWHDEVSFQRLSL